MANMKTATKEQKCIKTAFWTDKQCLGPFNKMNQVQKSYTRWEIAKEKDRNKETDDIKKKRKIEVRCT